MKKVNEKPAAEKTAKSDVKNASKNPLSSSVIKDDKKHEKAPESKPDPEQEKKIAEASKKVTELEKAYAEAKTKLSEAKSELRKLTGKKAKGDKGPGVISTIFTLIQKAPKKGVSKDEIYEKLVELFPDRAGEGMKKTINVQIPGRMSKEKKVNIVKLETGNFVIAE